MLRESDELDVLPPESMRLIAHLQEVGIARRALQAGERFPAFVLPSAEGHLISSDELFGERPVVISFIRGHWCRFCLDALNKYKMAEESIANAGGRLVVVTPDVGGRALQVKKRHHFEAEVLVDVDGGLALTCGLLFRLPEEMQALYRRLGYDLPGSQGNHAWFLPVPATYVVDRARTVRFADVEVDYRRRANPDDILNAIARLKPR